MHIEMLYFDGCPNADSCSTRSGASSLKPAGATRSTCAAPEVARAVTDRVAGFFDGVDDLEIGRFVEPPDALGRRVRATSGFLWHVDLSLSRMGPLRPARGLSGYRTPIEGFYLGSGGSHPTPGMSGLPGTLAGAEVLRGLRGARR
jgi:phytoene dehydrogenase-like protein